MPGAWGLLRHLIDTELFFFLTQWVVTQIVLISFQSPQSLRRTTTTPRSYSLHQKQRPTTTKPLLSLGNCSWEWSYVLDQKKCAKPSRIYTIVSGFVLVDSLAMKLPYSSPRQAEFCLIPVWIEYHRPWLVFEVTIICAPLGWCLLTVKL